MRDLQGGSAGQGGWAVGKQTETLGLGVWNGPGQMEDDVLLVFKVS